jgi:hypothetical protein
LLDPLRGGAVKLDRVSAIAEIVSSIAVLGTLVYLAVQTTQNTAAVQASTRQAMLAEDRELLALRLQFGVNELMGREVGSLSDSEKDRLSTWLVAFLRNRENQWLQRQNGVIDEETWRTYSVAVAPILSYEITRPWWEKRASSGEFDPGFTDFVNGILSETPVQSDSMSERTGLD